MKEKLFNKLFLAIALVQILTLSVPVFAFATPDMEISGTCSSSSLRWASSSNRVYISGGAVCTLEDIKNLGSKYISLKEENEGINSWILGTNIIIQEDATLLLKDGELKIESSNDMGDYVYISGKGGNLEINNMKITSWDPVTLGPDLNPDNGRAFIAVQSSLGNGEARMNVNNSDIGYLGFYGPEAYGLSWKVYGGSINIFDQIGVYGTVTNNKIHNNFFGIYTFGGEGMDFINNEIHDNVWYGLDPHDDSDNLLVFGNNVYGNGRHGIICSKRCDNIVISNNNSSYNLGSGIMIHRLVENSVIEENQTDYNKDSGIAVFDSHNNIIRNNSSRGNVKGIRLSVGSSGNIISNNTFSENSKAGVFTYKGTDLPISGDGRVKFNTFDSNIVHLNGVGFRIKESDNNTFKKNQITSNQKAFSMFESFSNILEDNFYFDN